MLLNNNPTDLRCYWILIQPIQDAIEYNPTDPDVIEYNPTDPDVIEYNPTDPPYKYSRIF